MMNNKKLHALLLLATVFLSFKILQSRKINIIFIGDSITEAHGIKDTTHMPSVVAGTYLKQLGFTGVHTNNQGKSGFTTVNFLPLSKTYQKVASVADNYYKDRSAMLIFSFMLGTNDSAVKGPLGAPVSPLDYRLNLKNIADSLLARYPKCRIVLNCPLWYSDSTHNSAIYLTEGRNRLQKYFPEKIKALVKQYKSQDPGHVFLGDTKGYAYFKKNYLTDMDKQTGPSGIFYLHPNYKGSVALGTLWAKSIAAILK